MVQKNVKIVRGFKLPAKEGSYYRIICMNGENKGITYYLSGSRVIMGRGKEVDIQVMDKKSSREHAELKLVDDDYFVTDLGSQNGVVVNDLKIKQHKLKSGDKIIIGSTVFKYDFIVSNPLTLVPEGESRDENDEDEEDDEISVEEQEKAKKRILILIGIFAFIYMMLDDGPPPPPRPNTDAISNKVEKDSFAEALRKQQAELDEEQKEKLQTIIHRGLRELRERNYLRAIEEFNLALILSPSNSRAQFYLSKAEQKLYEEVDNNMLKAKREESALKYNGALVSYCAVIRLLRKYPSNENYKDAEEEIKKLEIKLGLNEGAVDCLKSGEY